MYVGLVFSIQTEDSAAGRCLLTSGMAHSDETTVDVIYDGRLNCSCAKKHRGGRPSRHEKSFKLIILTENLKQSEILGKKISR